jgi:protein gp37
MSTKTAIEWAEATWNTTYGCTKIARPCANCYIYRTPPYRIKKMAFHKGSIPIVLMENRLTLPLTKAWREPKRIFVDSLSDLFHEDVPDWFIAKQYAVMLAAHWHTFQMLTKRPERRQRLLTDNDFLGHVMVEYRVLQDQGLAERAPLPPGNRGESLFANIWEGITIDKLTKGAFIDALQRTPAAIRWASVEPLLDFDLSLLGYLGRKDWRVDESEPEVGGLRMTFRGLDWVVVGGESGPQVRDGAGGARRALVRPCPGEVLTNRPFHKGEDCNVCDGSGWMPKPEALEAVRRLRSQCVAAGVPFLFKQWGGPTSKSGGRELDGRTWDEYPT